MAMGGHNIPEKDIRRRFKSGWRNLEDTYRSLVNETVIGSTYEKVDDSAIEPAMLRGTMKARRSAIALTGRVVTFRNGKVEYDTEP